MRRMAVLVYLIAVVLAGMVVLGARPAAITQEATSTAAVDHPVVGARWTANDAPGPGVETAYALFHDAQEVDDIPAATGSRVDDHSTGQKACTCGGPGVTHIRAGSVHS